ncbi:MAG TPA: hypothetical protein VFC17_03420 [Candidatus Limnocylindrales bacterium]|nr:hypothetical protein [Candidatus Limnocylindrales bacterium]
MSSATSHLSAEARASLPQHVAVIMDGNGRWVRAAKDNFDFDAVMQ